MSEGLRMVHLRTVHDAWHAKVLAARLGCEGIVTQLRGNLSGPYPFGAVSVLVEADQAELAAALLLMDEVESAFSGHERRALEGAGLDRATPDRAAPGCGALASACEATADDIFGSCSYSCELDPSLHRGRPWSRWQRALAATAAVVVAGAPLLAHFVGQ
jgi:hypothetical protein